VDTTGWQFGTAIAVSDDGRVVLGNGEFNGRDAAWLANLNAAPEPCSVSLVFAAMGALSLLRQKRSASPESEKSSKKGARNILAPYEFAK
jgi:hypothetical protein